MSTASRKVRQLAEVYGASLTATPVGASGIDLDCWAPTGKVFKATGGHCIALRYLTDPDAAWADFLEELAEGLEDCTDPLCDNCPDTTGEG